MMKYSVIVLLSFVWGIARAQPIAQLLAEAESNNPGLRALELRYEAALQQVDHVGEWPDPSVSLGAPVLRTATRLGEPVVTMSIAQKLPRKRLLQSQKSLASAKAQVLKQAVNDLKLELAFKIKKAYYQLYWLQKKQEILAENLRLAGAVKRVGMAKVESGSGSASDVLRLRIIEEKLKNDLEVIRLEAPKYVASINELTLVDRDTIEIFEEELKDFAELPPGFVANAETLIYDNYPAFEKIKELVEVSKAKQTVAQETDKFDFGASLTYSLVQKRSDANPLRNGRDLLIPMVSVRIPVFRKKYRAKIQEEKLIQQALESENEELKQKIHTWLIQKRSTLRQTRKRFTLYDEQERLTKSAYEILLGFYSSKGGRFNELLELQRSLFDYKLKKEKERVNFFTALASIQRLGFNN